MLHELWLIHPDADMCAAFAERFHELPRVRIFPSRLEDLPPHDAFVTAGNSFGIMNAGIDAAVAALLGPDFVARLQHQIHDLYLGELPIGTALVMATGHPLFQHLVYTPTMRVPGDISGTDKVYQATWAALLAIYQFNIRHSGVIRTAAFPAFGCGFGGVPYREAARQMAAAYRHFIDPPHRLDWPTVAARQKAIYYDAGKQVAR